MKFLQLVQSRYTTKKYNPDKRIPEETISELKEILRLSPSSINSQPWKFIFVSDSDVKSRLANMSLFNKEKVLGASHLVVFSVIDSVETFLSQLKTHSREKDRERYLRFVQSKPENDVKEWMRRQPYIALGFFLSACAVLQVDSTPMEGIDNDGFDEVLEDEGYKSMFAVALGYRANDDQNDPEIEPKLRLPQEKVIRSI
jgi:nitroreductase/dihydropteridine reductase